MKNRLFYQAIERFTTIKIRSILHFKQLLKYRYLIEELHELIEKYGEIIDEETDSNIYSMLLNLVALNCNSTKMVETLVELGANPYFINKDNEDIFDILINREKDSNRAVIKGGITRMQDVLFESFSKENLLMDDMENTKLHYAIAKLQYPLIKTLIKNGNKLDDMNKLGITPFEIAKQMQKSQLFIDSELINWLLGILFKCRTSIKEAINEAEHIINIYSINYVTDEYGNTSLLNAVVKGYKNIACFLLELGSDPRIKNYANKNALDLATESYIALHMNVNRTARERELEWKFHKIIYLLHNKFQDSNLQVKNEFNCNEFNFLSANFQDLNNCSSSDQLYENGHIYYPTTNINTIMPDCAFHY